MAQLDKLESLLSRLEAAVTRIEKSKVGGSSGASAAAAEAEGDAERVTALDEWYTGSFKPWLENSRKIGGLLNDAVCISSAPRVKRRILYDPCHSDSFFSNFFSKSLSQYAFICLFTKK